MTDRGDKSMADTRHQHIRSLGVGDMTLFTVSAILLLDTLAASASIGVSSIFWWTLLGIIFFIPYGLISAELGTTYPEQGGIYAWVRDTFGTRWGTRVTWLYWLNTAMWNGSILVLFSGIFAQMFFPDLSLVTKLTIAIVLNWVVILMTCVSLNIGKWVPNVGAALKMITFVALISAGTVLSGAILMSPSAITDILRTIGSLFFADFRRGVIACAPILPRASAQQ